MPSTKKRVNLTIPDEVYERLQAYKLKQGIPNDASACLQLIVKQLNGEEQVDKVFDFISRQSLNSLTELSREGFATILEARKPKIKEG